MKFKRFYFECGQGVLELEDMDGEPVRFDLEKLAPHQNGDPRFELYGDGSMYEFYLLDFKTGARINAPHLPLLVPNDEWWAKKWASVGDPEQGDDMMKQWLDALKSI